ncbi:MAG: FAD binding domain-containing protein [Lachnospiraceae bacterium]|nr:FAD binding domain-containing protein [Lachnospiraceae bacterium]
MLTFRNYQKVTSLEEAYELNQKKANKIIGGMLWMKMENRNIGTAIDLSGLGLDQIEETDEEFIIGCMATLRDVEFHPGLNQYTNGAIKESVRHIVGVQFRNVATIGGSIFGRFGFSDVLTMFMALDAYVELYKGGVVPIQTFARMERDNDILIRVIVKKTPMHVVYMSERYTKTDFPTIACAIAKTGDTVKAVIGARPYRAICVADETGILKQGITEDTARAFGHYVSEHVRTGSNMRGSREYRSHLIKVIVRRAVLQLGGEQNAD